MKRILTLAFSLIVLVSFSVLAQGQKESRNETRKKLSTEVKKKKTITLRLAHNHSEKGPYYITSMKFIELVERRSKGRIKVKHYHSGQLGADRDIQEGVQLGTIDAGLSSSPVASINSYFNLLDAPYLFVSRRHVEKVLDGEIGAQLARPLEKVGVKHLAYWENGFRQITNNVRAINVPADLAGIKLRTPENAVRMATFKKYGANPVPMSFKEVFGALQQGIIDGQENPLGTIYQNSLQEVQEYLSITGHVYSPVHLLMNKRFYDSLPSSLKKVVVDAARECAKYSRKLGAENDATLISKIKAAGVKVNKADIKAFVNASRPVWQLIVDKTPKHPDAAAVLEKISSLAD